MTKLFYFSIVQAILLIAGIPPLSLSSDAVMPELPGAESKTSETRTDDTGSAKSEEESGNQRDSNILKGGVRGSAVRLEEGLEMIEVSAKMVKGPALEIAQECTRKETAVIRGPNYIGNGIVVPAVGNPTGTIQIGELPARTEKLETFLSIQESAIKALRSHVDGLIFPEDSTTEMLNLWKGMQNEMQQTETNISSMRELLSQLPRKRQEIKQKDAKPLGQAALKIYDSMTALEKTRGQLEEILKAKAKNE